MTRTGSTRDSVEQGYLVLYMLAFVAWVVVAISLTLLALRGRSPTLDLVLLIAAACLGLALYLELRSDRLAAATFFGTMLVLTSLFLGSWWLAEPFRRRVGVLALALALSGALLVAGVFRARARPAATGWPNLLRESFSSKEIFEVSGIQVAAYPGFDETSGMPEAEVIVQNCYDARRRVRLLFTSYRNLRPVREGFDPEAERELEGGEVVVYRMPVRPPRDTRLRLHLSMTVSRIGGSRIRPWQAQGLQRHVSPALALLSIFGGIFHWGGGITLTFPPVADPAAEAGRPRWETLWRPDPFLIRDLTVPR